MSHLMVLGCVCLTFWCTLFGTGNTALDKFGAFAGVATIGLIAVCRLIAQQRRAPETN